MEISLQTITPDEAADILTRNPNNRTMSKDKISQYATDMLSGSWTINGETVIISDDDNLNDGQHRLEACVKAGVPFTTFLVRGVSRSSRITVDQGNSKNAGCYLSMDQVLNAKMKAGIARLLIAYEAGNRQTIARRGSISNSRIISRVMNDKRIFNIESMGVSSKRQTGLKALTGQMLGFLRYITHDVDENYFIQVRDGAHIGQGDPAFAVRRRLSDIVRQRHTEIAEVYLRGLIAYQKGQSLSRISTNGTLPITRLYHTSEPIIRY
jgi:hypothetical protein